MSEEAQTQDAAVDTSVDTGAAAETEALPDGVVPLPAEETTAVEETEQTEASESEGESSEADEKGQTEGETDETAEDERQGERSQGESPPRLARKTRTQTTCTRAFGGRQ